MQLTQAMECTNANRARAQSPYCEQVEKDFHFATLQTFVSLVQQFHRRKSPLKDTHRHTNKHTRIHACARNRWLTNFRVFSLTVIVWITLSLACSLIACSEHPVLMFINWIECLIRLCIHSYAHMIQWKRKFLWSFLNALSGWPILKNWYRIEMKTVLPKFPTNLKACFPVCLLACVMTS